MLYLISPLGGAASAGQKLGILSHVVFAVVQL